MFENHILKKTPKEIVAHAKIRGVLASLRHPCERPTTRYFCAHDETSQTKHWSKP